MTGFTRDDTGVGDVFSAGFLADPSAHLGTRVAAERVQRPTLEWFEPVASSARQFFAQLPEPVEEQSDAIRHVLIGSDAGETLELLVNLAPRLLDAAAHLRAALGLEAAARWTEEQLQHLVRSLLVTLFGDVRAEEFVHSVSGANCRIDLMLRRHGVGIEVELASPQKRDCQIGDELERHARGYAGHPHLDANARARL